MEERSGLFAPVGGLLSGEGKAGDIGESGNGSGRGVGREETGTGGAGGMGGAGGVGEVKGVPSPLTRAVDIVIWRIRPGRRVSKEE